MFTEQAKNRIEGQLTDLENRRAEYKKTVKMLWLICWPLMALMIYLMFFANFYYGDVVFFTGVIIIVGCFFAPILYPLFKKGGIVDDFKINALRPMIKAWRPEMSYHIQGHISSSLFNTSNLFRSPDRFSGEDLFEDKQDKTLFSFSEIHAEQKHTSTDSNGNTRTSYSTIFKGVFMIADFNKIIKSETYVYSTGGKGWFSGYERVKLENPDFEKLFDTYSKDQIEARYILTPKLMEQILDLREKFSENIYLSFRGSKIYIAIKSYDNFFDPEMNSELNISQIERIIKEIDSCIKIIDELDLNLRIWTKQ